MSEAVRCIWCQNLVDGPFHQCGGSDMGAAGKVMAAMQPQQSALAQQGQARPGKRPGTLDELQAAGLVNAKDAETLCKEFGVDREKYLAEERAIRDENATLRARVAELEAHAKRHEQYVVELTCERDYKREECERLELYASDLRQTAERLGRERDDARRELGATHAENARLRRELGRKR